MESAATKRFTGSRILIVPDLHLPFGHVDALSFCRRVRDTFRLDTVVFLGDEIDSHAISRYPKVADGMSAGQEFDKAADDLLPWISEFPKAHVCESNHTWRPYNLLAEAGLPARLMPNVQERLGIPKSWEYSLHWRNEDIVFEHGDQIRGGVYPYARAAMDNMVSTVIGHHHGRLGLFFHRTQHTALMGMGCGCLIDEEAYAFAYGRKEKTKPVLACAALLDGHPLLFKMRTNSKGRWNKRLGIEPEPTPTE